MKDSSKCSKVKQYVWDADVSRSIRNIKWMTAEHPLYEEIDDLLTAGIRFALAAEKCRSLRLDCRDFATGRERPPVGLL